MEGPGFVRARTRAGEGSIQVRRTALLSLSSPTVMPPDEDAFRDHQRAECGEERAAADELAQDGIDVEIVDLRTIRPLDIETILESVKKTGRLVIVEESFPVASIASEVGG